MNPIRAALLGITLYCTGCASLVSDMASLRETWRNATYEEVATRWGAPVRSTTFGDGRIVHTWYTEGTVPRNTVWPSIGVSAGSGSGVGIGVGVTAGAGRDVTAFCERTLVFQKGRVIEQTWHGPADFCGRFRRD